MRRAVTGRIAALERVLRREVSAVVAAALLAPAVVDDNCVLHLRLVEEPGQVLLRTVTRRLVVPLTVRPDDVRLVLLGELLELRQVDAPVPLLDRPRLRRGLAVTDARIVRVRILEHREVEAAPEARCAHRGAELLRKVASRTHRDGVVVGLLGRRPERIAVVVL